MQSGSRQRRRVTAAPTEIFGGATHLHPNQTCDTVIIAGIQLPLYLIDTPRFGAQHALLDKTPPATINQYFCVVCFAGPAGLFSTRSGYIRWHAENRIFSGGATADVTDPVQLRHSPSKDQNHGG